MFFPVLTMISLSMQWDVLMRGAMVALLSSVVNIRNVEAFYCEMATAVGALFGSVYS